MAAILCRPQCLNQSNMSLGMYRNISPHWSYHLLIDRYSLHRVYVLKFPQHDITAHRPIGNNLCCRNCKHLSCIDIQPFRIIDTLCFFYYWSSKGNLNIMPWEYHVIRKRALVYACANIYIYAHRNGCSWVYTYKRMYMHKNIYWYKIWYILYMCFCLYGYFW